MRRAGFLFLLFWTALAACPSLLRAADVFSELPALVATLQLRNADEAETELAASLQALYAYTPLRTPLRLMLGPVLRNPSLQGLPPGAPVDFFYFQFAGDKPVVWVAAFPILDKLEYRRILIGQASIREEATGSEIATYQEQTPEGSRRFFLDVQPGNIALMASDLDALKQLKGQYERLRRERLLPEARALVELRADVQKFQSLNAAWFDGQFRILRDDLVAEVAPEEQRAEHPLNVLLKEAFERLQRRLEQVSTLHVQAVRRQGGWRLDWEIAARQGSSVEYLFQQAPDTPLALGKHVPAECIAVSHARLWPLLWEEWTEGAGLSLAAGLAGGMNVDVRKAAADLVAPLTAGGILETVSGTVPAEAGYEESGPVLLRMIRWKNPAAALAFAAAAQGALEKGPLLELLEQNGIRLNLAVEPTAAKLGDVPVCRVRLRVQSGALGLGEMGQEQEYHLAQQNDVTLLTTSAGRQDEAARLLQLRILKRTLDSLATTVDKADTGTARAASYGAAWKRCEPEQLGTFCGLALVDPLQLLTSALSAVKPRGVAGDETARRGAEFLKFAGSASPLAWATGTKDGRLLWRMELPEDGLSLLLKACLTHIGIEAAPVK